MSQFFSFEIDTLTYEEQLLVLTLQGLVNRSIPRLFIDSGKLFFSYEKADKKWLGIYGQSRGYVFEKINNLGQLIDVFELEIKGLIIYDDDVNAAKYIAITQSALENLLPVNLSIFEEIFRSKTFHIRYDFRKKWDNDLEAYDWAISNLLPKCNKKVAFSAGRSHRGINLGKDKSIVLGLDYAVCEKGFVFNLSPADKPADFYDQHIEGYPDQAIMFDKIMYALESPAAVLGWAEPEGEFFKRVSKRGNFGICAACANLSFHAKVKPGQKIFRQRTHYTQSNVKLEKKYYISFVMNEGDTPKILAAFQNGGWLDPQRGKVPINWGINPFLVDKFPGLAEHYYQTATENDYFFAGSSGAGFVYIDILPDVAQYAKFVDKCLEIADLRVVDVWDRFHCDKARFTEYARNCGHVIGFTHVTNNNPTVSAPEAEASIDFVNNDIPLVTVDRTLFYFMDFFDVRTPEKLVKLIEEVARKHLPPFFIEVFGGVSPKCVTFFQEVAGLLDRDVYKIVRLDEMMSIATLNRSQSGRIGGEKKRSRALFRK